MVVSDDRGQFVCVPERATYALLDGRRRIVAWAQLDRGIRLGLMRASDGSVAYFYLGDGGPAGPTADGPYTWVLYSTPHKVN